MTFLRDGCFLYLLLAVAASHLHQGWAGMEFICGKDSLSLSMDKVCDNVWDCEDGSDELPSRRCPPMGPAESVLITSPGWPNKYPNNASVTWTFAAASGLPLLLKIVHFDLESDYDFLTIGGASNPADVDSVMTYQYGYNKYTRKPFEMFANLTGNDDLLTQHLWRSDVSELWMHFESDSEVTHNGFEMVLFTPEVCEPTWHYFEGSCYRLMDPVMQYGDASQYCSSLNKRTHLAVIQSREENDFVAMVAETKRAWIGASRNFQNSKEFSWVNGEKTTFENWRTKEPNNFSGRENCVEINYIRKGLWNDHFCVRKKPFVCETPAQY
ncbi:Lectin [Holothuria leucospilota]|uniref:Lectin n=1 Tax=Holothuria leucospilota TaxID=206669 RepID=A0A9Q0YIH7_HOLLE|nr:Lectin [Holothuria leucospilota]